MEYATGSSGLLLMWLGVRFWLRSGAKFLSALGGLLGRNNPTHDDLLAPA